ncbi:MAG: hypothetical protein KGJ06_01855 [Pseudomonadota bacterium]|nr:hypothetical protein [Pseudomonadota bacterium]
MISASTEPDYLNAKKQQRYVLALAFEDQQRQHIMDNLPSYVLSQIRQRYNPDQLSLKQLLDADRKGFDGRVFEEHGSDFDDDLELDGDEEESIEANLDSLACAHEPISFEQREIERRQRLTANYGTGFSNN